MLQRIMTKVDCMKFKLLLGKFNMLDDTQLNIHQLDACSAKIKFPNGFFGGRGTLHIFASEHKGRIVCKQVENMLSRRFSFIAVVHHIV